MDKYHTPTIDEFHLGFEYEWLKEDGIWEKSNTPTEISVQGSKNQTYGIRVKYLDKEDIESLGFIEIIKDQYIKKDFILFIDNDYFLQIMRDDFEKDIYLFQGTIKNKSELKVLLKQLGIND